MLSLKNGCFIVEAVKSQVVPYGYFHHAESVFEGTAFLENTHLTSIAVTQLSDQLPLAGISRLAQWMTRSPKWYEKEEWASTPRRQGLLEVVLYHPCTVLCRKESLGFVSRPGMGFWFTKFSALKGGDILPPPDSLLLYSKKCYPKSKWNYIHQSLSVITNLIILKGWPNLGSVAECNVYNNSELHKADIN